MIFFNKLLALEDAFIVSGIVSAQYFEILVFFFANKNLTTMNTDVVFT